MLERGKLNNGERLDYASGLVIGTYRGLKTVDHAGADAGYRSDLIRFPDQHFSSACLCNISWADPSNLNRKAAEIYLAREMKAGEVFPADEEKGVQLTPGQLQANAGTYLSKDDDVIRIFVKGNTLRGSRGNEEESFELKALSPNHFRLASVPVDFTFDAPMLGDAIRLTLQSQGAKPRIFSAVPSYSPSEAELRNFSGIYSSAEIDPLYVLTVEQGALVLHVLKNDPDKLTPVAKDLCIGSIGSLRFTRDSKGEVTGFLVTTGRIRNLRFVRGRPAIAAN